MADDTSIAVEDHPNYGPCDGFGPAGSCSQCTGLVERNDGLIIDLRGNVVAPTLPALIERQAAESARLRDPWRVIDDEARNGDEWLLWGACSRDGGKFAPDRNVGWWLFGRWHTRTPGETIEPTAYAPLPTPPAAED